MELKGRRKNTRNANKENENRLDLLISTELELSGTL